MNIRGLLPGAACSAGRKASTAPLSTTQDLRSDHGHDIGGPQLDREVWLALDARLQPLAVQAHSAIIPHFEDRYLIPRTGSPPPQPAAPGTVPGVRTDP